MKPPLPLPTLKRSGLAALLLLVAVVLTQTGLLCNIDRLFYDQFIRYSGYPPAKDIVIVAIDQHSLDKLGRWPWPRRLHVELLEKLAPFQPKGIAMDIVFSEPDTSAPLDDDLLAEAIAKNGPVVLPVLLEKASQFSPLRETVPLEKIGTAAAGLGHVDTEIDSDGIARSVFLKAGLGKPRWPSFALAMLQATDGRIPESALPGTRNPSPVVEFGSFWVRDYHVYVPFSGPEGHFQQVSFVDILTDQVPLKFFKKKYILVGATATGLGDTIPTPVSALGRPMSGVEFNANVLDALLRERLIVEMPMPLKLSINILVALICVLPFMVLRARRSLLWGVMLFTVTLLGSYLALSRLHTWFPPATALMIILTGFVLIYRHHLQGLLRSLFEERLRSKTALTSIADAVVRTDKMGRVLEINQAAEKFSSVSSTHALGKPVWEVLQLHTRHDNKPYPLQQCIFEAVQRRPKPLVLTNNQGEKVPVQLVMTPVPTFHEEQQEMIIVITDISEVYRLSKEITYHETHNRLTGLPNSTLISNRLKSTIEQEAQSAERILMVIVFNIDRFSNINQSLGNTAGDLLLQEVANRLKAFQHNGRTVAGHIGGDEFVLILGNVQDRGAMMPLLAAVSKALGNSVTVLDQELALTFAMGVSIFPEDGLEPEILLRKANTAMHRAKDVGQGATQLFTRNMQARVQQNLYIDQLLHQAIDKGFIKTFYQPLVKTDTLQIVGVEALMRLQDEKGDFFNPDEFIPLAEESSMIVELGNYQLMEACNQIVAWQELGISQLRLSYNLSPYQLKDPDLVTTVQQTISASGIPPHLLEFEITEHLLLEHDAVNKQIMEQLRTLGIEFAIDDFGTGYSSMNYLTRFPFRRLKIDMSLIWDLSIKPGSRAITSAITNMVHSLDMVVIAEGVELPSQQEILLSQGCDEVQGFLLGRPMSAEQFYKYYNANNGKAPI